MNTNEIYNFLHRLFKNKKCQYDVIPCDLLDNFKISQYPLYLVVNNMKSGHQGMHWLSIHIRSAKSPMIFFCSYGLGISTYDNVFRRFAHKHGRKIYQNTKQIQAFDSKVCGQHCIFFLWKCSMNRSLLSVYCNFSNNFMKNDKIVNRFVNSKNHLFHECKYKNLVTIQCCTEFNK
jgi:hypothetical protein